MNVLFYITGHGFGHSTRMIEVARALRRLNPGTGITFRTSAPESLFRALFPQPFSFHDVELDTGAVEKDVFHNDKEETLRRYWLLSRRREQLIGRELAYLSRHPVDRIVSDIPPLASRIGHRAGIPVVAISNFSWDFIYKPFCAEHPKYAEIVQEIRADYAHTDLLLRLPFSHEMEAFPVRQDHPLIAHRVEPDREALLADAGFHPKDSRPLVVVAFRFHDVSDRIVKSLSESGDFLVLSFLGTESGESPPNAHVLGPDWRNRFTEVLAAADLVISKPGYGIISECVANRTPLMTIPRFDFAEYPLLAEGMKTRLPHRLLTIEELRHGDLSRIAGEFLARDMQWPEQRLDGAEEAARILSFTPDAP